MQILAADPLTWNIDLESPNKRKFGTLSSTNDCLCELQYFKYHTYAHVLLYCNPMTHKPLFSRGVVELPVQFSLIVNVIWLHEALWKGDHTESGNSNSGLLFLKAAIGLLLCLSCIRFTLIELYLSQHSVQCMLASQIDIPFPQQKCQWDVHSVGWTSAFPFL